MPMTEGSADVQLEQFDRSFGKFEESHPKTLGEYRKWCLALGGPTCAAVRLLDELIAKSFHGQHTYVCLSETQMRALFLPRMSK